MTPGRKNDPKITTRSIAICVKYGIFLVSLDWLESSKSPTRSNLSSGL
jgi:hypothetical protein